MTVQLATTPRQKFFDNNGSPLASGQLFSYVAGTSTPQATWTDAGQSTQNPNPLILDARGECNLWLDTGLSYKFVLQDFSGNLIWSVDGIQGLAVFLGSYLPTVLTQNYLGTILFPQVASESASGSTPTNFSYPVGNVLRYGLVPNSVSSAASNTTILQALLNPNTGGVSRIEFPNTTGADTYYFTDLIMVRNGTFIEGNDCILSLTRTGVTTDTDTGFLHWLNGVTLQNLTINIIYTYGGGTNVCNAIGIGARGSDSSHWPNIYDSLLTFQQGFSIVRNVQINITTNTAQNKGQNGFFMLGGVQNLIVENVSIVGNNTLPGGVYAEFGWATNESELSARQTSHPNNHLWRDIRFSSITGPAFAMNGAYSITGENLYFNTVGQAVAFGPGEARYYRPWNSKDLAGAKHFIRIRNVVANAVSSSSVISVSGNNNPPVTGGYLSTAWTPSTAYTVVGTVRANGGNLYVLTTAGTSAGSGGPTGTGTGIVDGGCVWNFVPLSASSDLLDTIIEDVSVVNSAAVGIQAISPTRLIVRHAYLNGCTKGITVDQDCTSYSISDATILNSTSIALQIGLGDSVYSPARQSEGSIRNCFIAGTVNQVAIFVATSIGCGIENCRFGFETGHDGIAESQQLQAVSVAADASNVIVRNCYVAGVASGACFNLANSASSARGCRLQNISFNAGISATNFFTGLWLTDFQSATAQSLANGNTINCSGYKTYRVTNAGAVTGIIMPVGNWPDHSVTIFNENSSNSVTFAASGTSNVVDGTSDVIAGFTARTFTWNAASALWYPCK